jgi:hypothetical protein
MKIRFSEITRPGRSPLWRGELGFGRNPKEWMPIYSYTMPSTPEKCTCRICKGLIPDKHGMRAAQEAWEKKRQPRSSLREEIKAETFNAFKTAFLQKVQGWICDRLEQTGTITIPDDYQEKILTPRLILRLADILRRGPGKKFWQGRIEALLLNGWERDGFCKMDRDELAAAINAKLPIEQKRKPNSVWQMAYRLGLLSDRHPGPKQTF